MRCSCGGWTGHLPHEGGDRMSPPLSPITIVERESRRRNRQSPPQVGEMPGRAEGGAKELGPSR
ncbi:MAG: hypothetical protein EKK31_24750 [Hyphomicrobiales bacterium]|nr:MAG: hypothetical protein EKK31_24750 [Hyphomicrobiales bacterium]